MFPDTTNPSSGVTPGWREIAGATALFAAVVLLFAYPISAHPNSLRFPTGPDGDLGIYLLGWNTHAFLHRPWAIFEANIYYPQRLTLAYGENVIGLAFNAAPVIWVTGDLMLATNFVLFLSCVLCGLGAYVLARRLGLGVTAAILCGLIFEASPPRFMRVGQMNLSAVYWIPFGLAALHAYLDGGRKRHLRLAVALFTLQVLTSGHGAVFMVVALAGVLAYRVALGEPIRPLTRVRDFGVAGALLVLPSVLVFLPYRLVQQEVGLRRGLGSWGVTAESWLASPSHVHQCLLRAVGAEHVNGTADAFLFPGYLPLLLPVAAVGWSLWLTGRAIARGFRVRAFGAEAREGAALWRRSPERSEVPAGEATAAPGGRTGRAWRAAAALTEAGMLLGLSAAVTLTLTGPLKWKVGKTVLFSSRGPWRAWLLFGALCVARVLLMRRAVPLDVARRLGHARERLRASAVAALRASRRLGHRLGDPERLRRLRLWAERARADRTALYAFLTLLMWGLAIGPPYGLWQYVYALPGFSFIRASSRFTIVMILGLAVLSAIGFERLTARMAPVWRRGLGALVAILLVAEFAPMPMRAAPNNVIIPAIDRWLNTLPKPFVVAEVPTPRTRNRAVYERQQAAYMLHSTAHWQKTVHGYSGWRTEEHERLYEDLADFPDEKTLAALECFRVTYVVVHTDYYPEGEWPSVEERIRRYHPRLRFVHAEGAGRVYSLHPATPQP